VTAAVDLCRGTGVEVHPTPDGPTYWACTGCAGCGPEAAQRGRDHHKARVARTGGNAFVGIPTPQDGDDW
jgi:hypothetical protein